MGAATSPGSAESGQSDVHTETDELLDAAGVGFAVGYQDVDSLDGTDLVEGDDPELGGVRHGDDPPGGLECRPLDFRFRRQVRGDPCLGVDPARAEDEGVEAQLRKAAP